VGIRIFEIILLTLKTMKTLQEILDDFNKSNAAKLSRRQIGGLMTIKKNGRGTVVCPTCKSVGSKSVMKSIHFENCVRPSGYSNQVIVDKYVSGIAPSDISLECNITTTSVRRILAKMGHDPVTKMVTDRDDLYNKIIELKKQGYSNRKIHETLNTSNGTVDRAIRKWKTSNNI
jgi:hypothetical protein